MRFAMHEIGGCAKRCQVSDFRFRILISHKGAKAEHCHSERREKSLDPS